MNQTYHDYVEHEAALERYQDELDRRARFLPVTPDRPADGNSQCPGAPSRRPGIEEEEQ